jgi:hypothetical protein
MHLLPALDRLRRGPKPGFAAPAHQLLPRPAPTAPVRIWAAVDEFFRRIGEAAKIRASEHCLAFRA